MIRKLLLLSVLTIFCTTAKAGDLIEFGAKGGLNVTNVKLSRSAFENMSFMTDANLGYHFGLVARLNLVGVHVQPEINYNWNRYKLTSVDNTAAVNSTNVKYSTVEVPVLVGLKLLFLRVQAGPVFNLMNRTSTSPNSVIRSLSMLRPSMGYAVGLGIDFMKITFDVRYYGQFKKAYQTVQTPDFTSNVKSNLKYWSFSLGYLF